MEGARARKALAQLGISDARDDDGRYSLAVVGTNGDGRSLEARLADDEVVAGFPFVGSNSAVSGTLERMRQAERRLKQLKVDGVLSEHEQYKAVRDEVDDLHSELGRRIAHLIQQELQRIDGVRAQLERQRDNRDRLVRAVAERQAGGCVAV